MNYSGFEKIAPLVKNGGKAIIVLTILDLVLNSDAYAQQIGNDLKMYVDDCRRGQDAWAYVDLLMLRHDMNQLGLFAGDLAVRQILQSEKSGCK